MNRRTRFIVGFAAAALTFGTLTATVGFQRFHHRSTHCHNPCTKISDQSNAGPSPAETEKGELKAPVSE